MPFVAGTVASHKSPKDIPKADFSYEIPKEVYKKVFKQNIPYKKRQ